MHTRSALALKFNEHEKIISIADTFYSKDLYRRNTGCFTVIYVTLLSQNLHFFAVWAFC